MRFFLAERQFSTSANENVVRYKFAFQWCEEQGDPWWIPSQPVEPSMAGTSCLIRNSLFASVTGPYHLPEPNLPDNGLMSIPDFAAPMTSNAIPPNMTWQCASCHTRSPQVYAEGWMCLRSSCRAFWHMNGEGHPNSLRYSESFLQLQQLPAQELPDMRPAHPTKSAPDDGVTTTYHFTRGWHCRECGRLSCRCGYCWLIESVF